MDLQTKVKANDYGDLLAKIKGMELVVYQQYGSYQGEYLVVLRDKELLYFYMGSYGSCSGCDWLEAERNWETDEIDYKEALDYCQQITLHAKLPEKLWKTLTPEQKKMFVSADLYEKEEMEQEIVKF